MKTFKDGSGKTWCIQINVSTVKRCRAFAEVDLVALFDGECEALQKLSNDPIKFVEVLYVLCGDEAKERNISSDEFECSMSGDCINTAMNGFLEELIDFFPEERKRNALKKVLDASQKLQSKMLDQVESRIDEINLDEIAETMMNSSTGPQEFSELIQARLRAKNSH
jgi:hypothetical protein